MDRKVESFAELATYQEACALDFAIFTHTKSWPKEEMNALTDQIRRSSRSVGANIAEAWLCPVGDQTIGIEQDRGYAPEGLRPVGDQTTGLECERGYAPEGSKRRYPAHFVSKLTDANAELQETRHWPLRAKAYGYLDTDSFHVLLEAAKLIGRRLGSMLKSGDWS